MPYLSLKAVLGPRTTVSQLILRCHDTLLCFVMILSANISCFSHLTLLFRSTTGHTDSEDILNSLSNKESNIQDMGASFCGKIIAAFIVFIVNLFHLFMITISIYLSSVYFTCLCLLSAYIYRQYIWLVYLCRRMRITRTSCLIYFLHFYFI